MHGMYSCPMCQRLRHDEQMFGLDDGLSVQVPDEQHSFAQLHACQNSRIFTSSPSVLAAGILLCWPVTEGGLCCWANSCCTGAPCLIAAEDKQLIRGSLIDAIIRYGIHWTLCAACWCMHLAGYC